MNATIDTSIAVVCGGPSSEAEVSRSSGRCVAEALKQTYPNVVLLELDKHLSAALAANSVDVVFPALHGPPGEDGTFQGFLETQGYRYVGSGVRASSFAMDKSVAKCIFRQAGIPVARDINLEHSLDLDAACQHIEKVLGDDVVIKPSSEGSAVGVRFANSAEEIEKRLQEACLHNGRVLVEERIIGREITVGILDTGKIEVFPVIEVRTPKGAWYDYEHRYTEGASEHIIPAPLSQAQYQRTQEIAVLAHKALGCRHLSRADFVVPEHGEPVLLEVNTLPGMTPTSLYPDGARAIGLSFESLVSKLIEGALEYDHG
ncbi:D-alanine--D-alanine ligase [Porticoccus sp. W117]|uniref:D-alanine--D-alanine ligase family protein n=1 Tax=Porticoccus sp. W117 TaxID=3054777 RepID=UPI0025949741|nr:D-alanine--D-alanine ligase [Porticoccus sp. W117]MDM3871449.1 D-alanine--D-alanine ligase [Porticoccus sp. W117]